MMLNGLPVLIFLLYVDFYPQLHYLGKFQFRIELPLKILWSTVIAASHSKETLSFQLHSVRQLLWVRMGVEHINCRFYSSDMHSQIASSERFSIIRPML